MRVQRIEPRGGCDESWTVLDDDWHPIDSVDAFLAHLTDQRRSPNTVRAYAHGLKDFFTYLAFRGLAWDRLRYNDLAAFKPWLRQPPALRGKKLAVLPSVEMGCAESTINRKLAAVTSFYEFHRRHGVDLALVIKDAARRRGPAGTSYRPFLVHVQGQDLDHVRPIRDEIRERIETLIDELLPGATD